MINFKHRKPVFVYICIGYLQPGESTTYFLTTTNALGADIPTKLLSTEIPMSNLLYYLRIGLLWNLKVRGLTTHLCLPATLNIHLYDCMAF